MGYKKSLKSNLIEHNDTVDRNGNKTLSAAAKKNVKLKAELVKNARRKEVDQSSSGADLATSDVSDRRSSATQQKDAAAKEKTKRRFTIGGRKISTGSKPRSPICAFLVQEAQLFGAVSLPNLDDALTSAAQADTAGDKTTTAAAVVDDVTEQKLDAYRRRIHRLDSSNSACSRASTSSLASNGGGCVADDVVDEDAHSQFVNAGKARSFPAAGNSITADETPSNFQRMYYYAMDTNSSHTGDVSADRRSLNNHSGTLRVVRDAKARSCENEMNIETAAASTSPPSERMSTAQALAKNLEPEFRQRLFTAPPAMMRPSRKAFRLKSGQRHQEADVSHVFGHGRCGVAQVCAVYYGDAHVRVSAVA